MKQILIIVVLIVVLLLTGCGNPLTPNMVWVNPTGTVYHKKSCQYVDGDSYSMTKDRAKELGYRACRVCY